MMNTYLHDDARQSPTPVDATDLSGLESETSRAAHSKQEIRTPSIYVIGYRHWAVAAA